MPTYFLLDPFEFPYYFYRIRGELIWVLSEHQNNKQKLQILEALYIRNLQPALNRINFQTSANVFKCL